MPLQKLRSRPQAGAGIEGEGLAVASGQGASVAGPLLKPPPGHPHDEGIAPPITASPPRLPAR